jgi:thiol-disulfide isomerase/thioredoxin
MKKNVLLFGLVGLAFAAIGAFFGLKRIEPTPPHSPAVANLLAQSMEDVSGQMQPLSQWQNKALIVNFWATWCAPCVDEMPELSQLQNEIAPSGMQIIGVGIDSSANIRQFASKHNISYPLYTGGVSGTDLARQFGNQAGGLPFTVLVGRDGQVKKTYLGRLKLEQLKKDLALL